MTLADAQALAPTVSTAAEAAHVDTANVWIRSCDFTAPDVPGPSVPTVVDLAVAGAFTPTGEQDLEKGMSSGQTSDVQVSPVSGVGERAFYSTYRGELAGLTAQQNELVVGLTVYFGPTPTAEALAPLLRKVLGKLP